MEKKCYTCKYENYSVHEHPCQDCTDHKYWIEKEKESKVDSMQLWSELVQMYCRALGGNEKVDYDTYDIQCDRFREKLSEFYEAIKEECW